MHPAFNCLYLITALSVGVSSSAVPEDGIRLRAKSGTENPYGLARRSAPRPLIVDRDVNNASLPVSNALQVVIGIGTPPQNLDVGLDSGSNNFIVDSTLSAKAGFKPGTNKVYDPSKSSSAVLFPNTSWTEVFEGGNGDSGPVYTDTITLGQTVLRNIPVLPINSSGSGSDGLSGIIGINNGHAQTTHGPGHFPQFVQAIKSQLASKRALFTLSWNISTWQGEIDFGFIDSNKYVGDITYHKLIVGSGEWVLPWEGIVLDGKLIDVPFNAGIDTGQGNTGFIPGKLLSAYFAKVNGSVFSNGGWSFPCDSDLPDLIFSVGGQQLTLSKLAWIGGPIGSAEKAGARSCFSFIYPIGNFPVLIGLDLIAPFFTIFDQDNNQLGFATPPPSRSPSAISTQAGVFTYYTSTNFAGTGTSKTITNAECNSLAGSTGYNNLKSFQFNGTFDGQGLCSLYSDTSCHTPLIGGIDNSLSTTDGNYSKIKAYSCTAPLDFPSSPGKSSIQFCTGLWRTGTCESTNWSRYECHDLSSTIKDKVKSFSVDYNNRGYCWFFQNSGCGGLIGNAAPYQNSIDWYHLPIGSKVSSFLCI